MTLILKSKILDNIDKNVTDNHFIYHQKFFRNIIDKKEELVEMKEGIGKLENTEKEEDIENFGPAKLYIFRAKTCSYNQQVQKFRIVLDPLKGTGMVNLIFCTKSLYQI